MLLDDWRRIQLRESSHVRRLGGIHYELTHDRLAEAIACVRPWRMPTRYKWAGLVGAVAVVVIAVLVGGHARQLQEDTRQLQEARDRAEGLVEFLIGENFLAKIRPVGRTEILKAVQKQVDAVIHGGRPLTDALAHKFAGDLAVDLGSLKEASASHQEAISILDRQLEITPDDLEVALAASRSHDNLGTVLRDQGRTADALGEHRRAVAAAKSALDRAPPGDTRVQIQLSRAQSDVASDLRDQGDAEQALAGYDEALGFAKPLEKDGGREVLLALHDALDGKATALDLLRRGGELSALYADESKVVERLLSSEPLAADARMRKLILISRVQQDWSNIEPQKLLSGYQQLHESVDELTRWDEHNQPWARDWAITALLVGQVQAFLGHPDLAVEWQDKALNRMRQLVEEDDSNVAWKGDLAAVFSAVATRLAKKDNQEEAEQAHKEAEETHGKAIELLGRVASVDATNAEAQYQLANALVEFGPHIADAEARIEPLKRAEQIAGELARAHPTTLAYEDMHNLAMGRRLYALQQAGTGEEIEELQHRFLDSVDASRTRVADSVSAALENEYGLQVLRKGLSESDPRAALAPLTKAVGSFQSAVNKAPKDPVLRDNLRQAFVELAERETSEGKHGAALEHCRGAAGQAAAAAKLRPANLEYACNHSDALLREGNALVAVSRVPEALQQYRDAASILRSAARAANTASLRDSLATPLQALSSAQRKLADALAGSKRPALAVRAYLDASRTLVLIARGLAQSRRSAEARQEFTAALANLDRAQDLSPSDAEIEADKKSIGRWMEKLAGAK